MKNLSGLKNLKGYKDIKKFTTLNIAGAESIPTARAFKKYLEEDVFRYIAI